MLKILDSEFNQEVRQKNSSIVILFSNDECQSCKQVKTTIEEISQTMPNIRFIEMEFSELSEIVDRFNIRSAPALVIFVNGMLRNMYYGSVKKHDLRWWLNENI